MRMLCHAALCCAALRCAVVCPCRRPPIVVLSDELVRHPEGMLRWVDAIRRHIGAIMQCTASKASKARQGMARHVQSSLEVAALLLTLCNHNRQTYTLHAARHRPSAAK
jgi:hypothetical protein